MTKLGIFLRNNKICYEKAGSIRDTMANYAILLPSKRVIYPEKHVIVCEPVEDDTIIIKRYTSNRGVRYVTIYKITNGKLEKIYSKDYFDEDEIKSILEKQGLGKDLIEDAVFLAY